MNKSIAVSIIMPVYNSQKYLGKTINSFLNQSLKSIELICVNDCSTDDSLKILKEFQRKDNRIRVIDNKKNVGPGESRNIGISVARGEYVGFLDSDDWFEKNACEVLYKKAKEENADIVYIWPKLVFSNKTILDKRLLTDEDVADKETVFRKNLLRKVAWSPWSKLVRREMIVKNNIRFPNIYIAEDMDFSYKLIYYAKKITYAPEYLYDYYLREDSLMAYTKPKRRIDNYFESINLLKKFLEEKGILEKYHMEYIYFKLYNYLAIYGVMCYSKEKINKESYKENIKNDEDFRLSKIIRLGIFDSVVIGSILIKLNLFNPVFKMREKLRVLFGKWGSRGN